MTFIYIKISFCIYRMSENYNTYTAAITACNTIICSIFKGMIKPIVEHLSSVQNLKLTRLAAAAIYGCAEDAETRDLVREANGLVPLVAMAKDPIYEKHKNTLAAITGAIWKCAANKKNITKFNGLYTVQVMVSLLKDDSEDVLTNAVGALSELCKHEDNRSTLRLVGGLPLLIHLLHYIWPPLLENVTLVLKECALESDSMQVIEQLDGVRLIWSLLKNKLPSVQANAAWALVPCIRNASDSGEMVREFVGGLELVVKLLKSSDNTVLAAICATLAEIAKDEENLGVLTDHGYVTMLVDLIHTKDELLQENLAKALAYSCAWKTNSKELGRLGAITPLVNYLAKGNPNVQRTAALALYHLSKNSFNCITMHESGVTKFLLRVITSDDGELQEAAAGCLANIRKVVLDAETFHLVDKGFPQHESSSTFA